MVNTTEVVYTASKKSTDTIFIVICLFVILVHIAIIYAISTRNRLAKNRYYIVASISTSDCCGCLFLLIWYIRSKVYGHFVTDITLHVLSGLITASLRVSLLCTCMLSFDRYIAVSRPLRYHHFITAARIFKAISSFFVLSLLLLLVSQLGIPKHNGIEIVAINVFSILVTSTFILSIAGYTIKMRKRHIANIRSRNLQFGTEAEKLNLLKSLKGSLHDVMRLNVLTVIFILLIGIFSLLTLSFDEEIFKRMRALAFSLYVLSNPIIYISVLSELRAEIKKMFCGNNRVNVELTDPVNRVFTVRTVNNI